jgi:hypothetical protein
VTINGTNFGPTPVEAVIAAGNARITCKPPTGATLSQSVRVGTGEIARVSFKLEP